MDASVSFERSWYEYVAGFGDVDGNFWLGLETIHNLTEAQPMKLQIDVVPFDIPAVSVPYPQFHVGDAASEYLLTITSDTRGHSTLCNSFTLASRHKFTTYDRDNDYETDINYAAYYRAGWWFSSFSKLNLNGVYGRTSRITPHSIHMYYLSDYNYEPIRTVTMKIKAVN